LAAPLEKIVIVGASLAGLRAAEALRQLGFEGRVALVGDEDALPYDRPPLSKDVLRAQMAPEQTTLVRNPERFAALDLDLHLGRRANALDADAHTLTLDDGTRLAWDGAVITTGATPRRLPGQEAFAGIYTLRTLDDALALRRELERNPRVVVVGAGFIGAEVAASCRSLGLDTTLLEALPVPIAHAVGTDVGTAVASLHRDHGVDLRLGTGVDAFEGCERVEAVRLSDGSRVEADVVVVGVGVTPNVDWLAGSGVATGNGVLCDAHCRSSLPAVVAAGDVASWYNPLFEEQMRIEHWTNASEMARAAVENLLAADAGGPEYAAVPFFWSDQYDVKIQAAGRPAGADESAIVSGSLAEGRFLKLYGRKGRLVAALAFNEPRKLIAYRRKLRETPRFADAVAEARD